jgi:hydroxyacylglutathione hydrolase
VFVTDADTNRAELVRQCLTIGYEHLAGELDGGIRAWQAAGQSLEQTSLVPAARVPGRVLDVRQDAEYDAGHLPGAAHVELGSLGAAVGGLDPGPLTVMCGHGERAMTAASLLSAAGGPAVTVAVGGPEDWMAATGRPLATGR